MSWINKAITSCALLLCVCVTVVANERDGLHAFEALVHRIVPKHADFFKAELKPGDGDFFELSSSNKKIVLKGNSANSLAVGLNYYLKYYCLTSVSWYADDPVELPNVLPIVIEPVKKSARVSKRFFLNHCTFGYTMPWWQWRDWERLIDWMALNGINMPLAITGQEEIWGRVWKKFGLTGKEISDYFTGPAHLPWHRMSNLDKWQGPLPQSYIQNQFALQKRIVARERELNMTPVLPAFAGHVPAALQKKYPSAKISRLGDWGGFPDEYRTYFLDPFDTLFTSIQKEFLAEQEKEFGTGHVYGADPFNEVKPPSWAPSYLSDVSAAIYKSIAEADSSATWMMMSWIFYFERENWTNERVRAFVKAVPQNKILLLDYFCENTEVWRMTDGFYQQPYLWCYLGNFGGNTALAGNLKEVSKRMDLALRDGGKNLWGIGATPEGLDVNPLMYEFVFEKIWNDSTVTPEWWITRWADRRTGSKSSEAEAAWTLLLDSVYTEPTRLGQATLTNARPTLTGSGNWTTEPTFHYSNQLLFSAWKKLMSTDSKRSAARFDVVNMGRQFLGNYFLSLRDQFSDAYKVNNIESLKSTGRQMISVLEDLDSLLNTHHSFRLSQWIEDARRFGVNDAEKKYYEQNARVIVSTWGREGQSLNDYANRNWAGLTKTYYAPRWRMFIAEVIDAAEHNRKFDEEAFRKKVIAFEGGWARSTATTAVKASVNSVELAKALSKKYQPSNEPLELSGVLADKGSYFSGDQVAVSLNIRNMQSRPAEIVNLSVVLRDISKKNGPAVFSKKIGEGIRLDAGQQFSVDHTSLVAASAIISTPLLGVYVEYELKGSTKKYSAYGSFFRIVDSSQLTTYRINHETFKGLDVYALHGGMSAECAVEKSVESLKPGISHSWYVNAPGSGPEHVLATPQFLENAVKQTVNFYDQSLGADTRFETVIIGPGLESVPYLSYAMKAPFLPLHFLASGNTVKEIQSVLKYANDNGYSSYATLGHDASVPYSVSWIKLLKLPREYIQFLKQHKVKNLVVIGYTGQEGENTAKKVGSTGLRTLYQQGDLYMLYPGGGSEYDLRELRSKVIDFDEVPQQQDFITIADWESGITSAQAENFIKDAKSFGGVKETRIITSEKMISLWDLATYVSAALIKKNLSSFKNAGPSPVRGITLNPYFVANPPFEGRFNYLPFIYWQLNPPDSTMERLVRIMNKTLQAYLPGTTFSDLECWINSARNFGGGDNARELKTRLMKSGVRTIRENDYTLDDVWDLSDGMRAPVEQRAAELTDRFAVDAFRDWNEKLSPLTLRDLDEMGLLFPPIEVRKE